MREVSVHDQEAVSAYLILARETDKDGFENLCDADIDNNGFVSFTDLNIFRSFFGQPPEPIEKFQQFF